MKLLVTLWLAAVGICSSQLASTHSPAPASSRQRIVKLADEGKQAFVNRRFRQALESYNQALLLAKPNNDYLATAALHNLLGEVCEDTLGFQYALAQYETGMRVLRNKSIGASAISVIDSLDRMLMGTKAYMGRSGEPVSTDLYRGEIQNLRQLLNQPKAKAHDELISLLTMNAGSMYLQQRQFRQADTLYLRALLAARKLPTPLLRQQIFTNLAWGAIKGYRFEQADVWLDSVMAISAKPSVELRRAALAIGVNLREKKNFPRAKSNIEQALALYKTAGDKIGYRRALAHLATTYFFSDSLEKAAALYREALQLNQPLEDLETNWHATGGLAKCFYRRGDYQQALRFYEKYVAILQQGVLNFQMDQGRVSFLEDHTKIFEEYAQVALLAALESGEYARAREAIERVRGSALPSLQNYRYWRVTDPNLYQQKFGHLPAGYFFFRENWPNIEREFSMGVPSSNMMQQTAPGVQSLPDIMNKMAPGIPAPLPPGQQQEISLPDSVTPPPVTFLEYFLLDQHLAILVKSPAGKIHGATVNIAGDSLDALINDYVRALEVEARRGITISRNVEPVSARKPSRPEAETSRKLYALLIAPVKNYLPANPAATLVIVPHRHLWRLPFAALRDEQNKFFADAQVMTFAASEASWRLTASIRRASDHRDVKAWIVGNPRMPQAAQSCGLTFSLQPLVGAQEEAKAIAGLLGKRAELFTGKQADRLRFDAWHAKFNVLHFATHGYACEEEPFQSFIALAEVDSSEMQLNRAAAQVRLRHDSRWPVALDSLQQVLQHPALRNVKLSSYPGLLPAWRITEYNLNADLVVMSACQTGLGQLTGGEGMIGFSRAFLAAGARSFLVSLWNVDDNATKELMITFYKEYLRHGNKGLALQRAMQQTRQRHPAPKYWAAFTLVGMAE